MFKRQRQGTQEDRKDEPQKKKHNAWNIVLIHCFFED